MTETEARVLHDEPIYIEDDKEFSGLLEED